MMNKYTSVLILSLLFTNASCIKNVSDEAETSQKAKPTTHPKHKTAPVLTTKDLVVPQGLSLNPTYLFTVELNSQSDSERYISICYERLTSYEENCIFKGRFQDKEISQTISVNNPNKNLVITYINFNQQVQQEVNKQVHTWSYTSEQKNLLILSDKI